MYRSGLTSVVDKTTLVITILHIFLLEMKSCEDMKRQMKNVGLAIALAAYA